MAKKTSEPKAIDIDAEVKKALLKIATADGPMRFVKVKGGHPHVFTTANETVTKVIEKCLDPVKPLVTETGSDKDAMIVLTAAGQELVASVIEEKGRTMPPAERLQYFSDDKQRKLFPAQKFEEVVAALTADIARETAAREEANHRLRLAEEEDKRKLAAALRAIDEGKKVRIASLKRELAAEGETDAPVSAPEGQFQPLIVPFPTDGNVNELRRKYALIVAGAWYDAASKNQTDVAKSLRRVLRNVGNVDLICDTGDVVPFDPALHECSSACATGDSVRVIYSGWLLREAEGVYVLRKAIVEQ